MSKTKERGLDIEAIIDGLCVSKIDGSISWIWDGGFYARLGSPPLAAEGWSLPTVGKALQWLRDTACQNFPDSDFARAKPGGGSTPESRNLDIAEILTDLYDSEMNVAISWRSPRRFHAVLGNPKLAEGRLLTTIRDTVLWLRDAATQHFPNSSFAQKYGGFGGAPPSPKSAGSDHQ